MTIAPMPPPPPAPASLEEFLARYIPPGFRSGGVACPAAARVAVQLVTAASRGEEMPSLAQAGLSGEDLYAVDDVLSELYGHAREFPSSTALLLGVLREYRSQVEIAPQRREPGAPPGLRPRPTARIKPAPSPVFRPRREGMTLSPIVVAAQLHELAASADAASAFLRDLAAAVGNGPGQPGQDPGADTTSLNAAGREAVDALLQGAVRTLQAEGKGAHSADLHQILKAWQDWRRSAGEAPR